jgi:hypothetical protein
MSIYAVNENKVHIQISTNKGWEQYGDWAESLPRTQWPEVVNLWLTGLCKDAPLLASQLESAQTLHSPNADVRDIIKHILEVCEGALAIMITNGIVPSAHESG